MNIGIVFPQIELAGQVDQLREFAIGAEARGFSHITLYDHVLGAEHKGRDPKLIGPYTENDPFHDPLVAFAYLAGLTQRIEFATGILILPQRQTALVARQAADLDLMSDGRLRLGVGTGWNYVEYDALGQDFSKRGKRLSEQIALLRRLWSEPLVSFEGQFDSMERISVNPRPSCAIPIWTGGFIEPAFRRGAQLCDGHIFAGQFESDGRPKNGVLASLALMRELLSEYEREECEFGFDVILMFEETRDQVLQSADLWREAGGTHLTLFSMGKGFSNAAQHLDYLSEIKEALENECR